MQILNVHKLSAYTVCCVLLILNKNESTKISHVDWNNNPIVYNRTEREQILIFCASLWRHSELTLHRHTKKFDILRYRPSSHMLIKWRGWAIMYYLYILGLVYYQYLDLACCLWMFFLHHTWRPDDLWCLA
jgi:hypothetical protein